MYKLLIVDDESETLNGIHKFVSWESLNVREVKMANNAEEAIKICSKFAPEIIISDIRMPNINGIEFCTVARNLLPLCQVIFISAFADKDYLKAAINLDVVSYVEKPINIAELEGAIKKAVSKLENIAVHKDELSVDDVNLPFLRELTVLNIISERKKGTIKKMLASAQLFQNGESYFIALFFKLSGEPYSKEQFEHRLNEIIEKLAQSNEFVLAFCDVCQAVAIISSKEKRKFDKSEKNYLREEVYGTKINGFELFCGIGNWECNTVGISASYRQAIMASQKLFFTGYGATIHYSLDEYIVDSSGMLKSLEQIETLVMVNKLEELIKELEDLYLFFKEQINISVTFVKNHYLHIAYIIAHKKPNKIHLAEQEDLQQYFLSVSQEIETLEQVHEDICDFARKELEMLKHSGIVTDTIQIIEKKYSDKGLKIKHLAESVYVTPSYLSRIFKEETDKTLLQYITGVRIDNAKQLLADKKLKLYHVAAMVGYVNAVYFSKVFKKETSLLPSQYRQLIKGELPDERNF